jgi:hypothetical protein
MINLVGSAQRPFVFPADLPLAYAYYGDVGRVLTFLPHIRLVRSYGPDRFRLLYTSTELGVYHIRIFADVQTMLEEGRIIRIHALEGHAPAQAKATFNSATAHGYFQSRSVFHDQGDQTRVDYSLELRANLLTPKGLRLMPGRMVHQIAKNITNLRIREITEGFIERSLSAFPDWVEEIRDGRVLPQDLSDTPDRP